MQLQDVKVIWRQVPKTIGRGHFGGRLVFAPDGKLFITSGDRQRFDPAQDPASQPRQGRSHQPRRLDPGRQPVRRARRARGPTSGRSAIATRSGAAINPASKTALDPRDGAEARRRAQHPGARQELRLAGREQRRQLRRQPDPRPPDAARVRRARLLLAPGDLAVGAHLLHGRPLRGLERATRSSAASRRRRSCGSRSRATA